MNSIDTQQQIEKMAAQVGTSVTTIVLIVVIFGLIITFVAFYQVLTSNMENTYKVMWILVFFYCPILGPVLYWLFPPGLETMKGKGTLPLQPLS